MTPKEAVRKCFDEGRVMQLGTMRDGLPRVNSVFYVPSDDYRSVYWMSEPRRRHSVDIRENPDVGGAIVTKSDWPVIGLQFTGVASAVEELDEIAHATEKYNEKYDYVAEGFVERFKNGKNKHLFYKLAMTSLEIFDQDRFGNEPVEIPLD